MVAKLKKKKPPKPSKSFPLYAHSCGQWCKTFKGEKLYFGTWDDPPVACRLDHVCIIDHAGFLLRLGV